MGSLIGSESREGGGCQCGNKLSHLCSGKQNGGAGSDLGFYDTPFLRAPQRSQRVVIIPFKAIAPMKVSY